LGVLVLLAGYLLFGRGGDDSAAQNAGPVAHTLSPQQVVRQVVLTDADLKGGLHATLITGGDQVKGQVTFDLCGYRYTSEAHRVARRQVGIVDAKRQFTGASNEVVVYDSVASATTALAELRTAFAHCPHTYVRDATAPHPMLLYSAVKTRSATGAQIPHPGERVDEVLVATWTAHQRTPAETGYGMIAVVRYKSVVSVVWFASATAVTADTARIVSALSDLTARKIPAS
jgi:hypothetical protein